MRDPGDLRNLAARLYTGNWNKDSQCVTAEEREEYRKAWDGEASRAYDRKERASRITDRNNSN